MNQLCKQNNLITKSSKNKLQLLSITFVLLHTQSQSLNFLNESISILFEDYTSIYLFSFHNLNTNYSPHNNTTCNLNKTPAMQQRRRGLDQFAPKFESPSIKVV